MNSIRDGTKWYTVSTYVDIETGEIIAKSAIERNEYRIINKNTEYEHEEYRSTRRITFSCRSNGQTELEFEW